LLGAERFLVEIETTAQLQHPHILPLYDSGEADGFLYYVMPYVRGESLRELLERERQLPVDEAVRIGVEVADALAYAHCQGVVHRDVKPANVLLKLDERKEKSFPYQVKLADLGLARPSRGAGDVDLTMGSSIGTPATMAPEQNDAPEEVDQRTDIYGLGCVFYEMLTGRRAFRGDTRSEIMASKLVEQGPDPREIKPEIPEAASALVRSMLARRQPDRPQSYEEILAALDAIPEVVEPGSIGTDGSGSGDGRGGTRLRVAAGIVALVVVVALGFFVFDGGDGPTVGIEAPSEAREGDRLEVRLPLTRFDAETRSLHARVLRVGDDSEIERALAVADDGASASLTFVAPQATGPYELRVLAAIGRSNEEPAEYEEATVAVAADDDPPTVEIEQLAPSGNGPVKSGDTVRLAARATDPENVELRYRWSCDDAGVRFEPPGEATTSVTVPDVEAPGELRLGVEVSDGTSAVRGELGVPVEPRVRELAVEIEGVEDGIEGPSPLRLDARVEDAPADLEYLWRVESGPAHVLHPSESSADVTVERLLIDDVEMSVRVDVRTPDGSATGTASHVIRWSGDSRHAPVDGERFLYDAMKKELRDFRLWRTTGPGAWGQNEVDVDKTFIVRSGDALTTGELDLPRGSFDLACRIEPDWVYSHEIKGNRWPRRVLVGFDLGPGDRVRVELWTDAPRSEERPEYGIRVLHGDRRIGEDLSLGDFGEAGIGLPVRMEWAPPHLGVVLGNSRIGEVQARRKMRPRFVLSVDRGSCVVEGLRLER